jgi:hypothetical protein
MHSRGNKANRAAAYSIIVNHVALTMEKSHILSLINNS